MKRKILSISALMIFLIATIVSLAGCDSKVKSQNAPWPANEYSFMADIPQFSATADVVNNNESSEILYIGYINATLPETINYINRLLDSGFVSAEYSDPLTSTKDTLSEGRFYWSSKLTRGEILIEILWYDKDVAVKSGDQEYNYSLTIKICNMEISE